nr:zinc finger, CCHC-type [Tanacetum cinerariifolium]
DFKGIEGYYRDYTLAKGTILGIEIIRDQSGNTSRVSQSTVHNGKSVQTLLDGHSIPLKGTLSQDCDVEKNGSKKVIMLHMMDLLTTKAVYMPLTKAVKEAI